jgi:hypothetical protein
VSVARAKGAKGKADRLFGQLIRSRGRCENCGTPNQLTTAHIARRTYSFMRCREDNALCLCASCHARFDLNELFRREVIDRTIGQAKYEAVLQEARDNVGAKVRWQDVAVSLQQRLREVA